MKIMEGAIVKRPQAPCRGCSDGYIGCHSKCEGYVVYKSELNRRNVTIRTNKKQKIY